MCASIREFGFKIPGLVRSDGEVVDGHLRLKAARKLGRTEIPVILCDEWTPAQVKAFRLMVNRSVSGPIGTRSSRWSCRKSRKRTSISASLFSYAHGDDPEWINGLCASLNLALSPDAPVVDLVRIRQRRLGDAATKAHVVELALHRAQARLDVAQAFAIRELSKTQAQKLIPARKSRIPRIAAITAHAFIELVGGHMSHHLREDRSAKVHAPLSDRPAHRADLSGSPKLQRKNLKSKNLPTRLKCLICYTLPLLRPALAGHYCEVLEVSLPS
jgi:hypothetical protein